MELICKLKSNGVAEVNGNATTFSILIWAFLHSGNISKAKELYEEMVKRGLKPDAKTYFTMISVAAAMAEDGFSPYTKSYNILIASFYKRKRLDRARDLLDEISHNGIKPNDVTYGVMIHGLCRCGDEGSGMDVIRAMDDNRVVPNVIVFKIIMDFYADRKELETTLSLMEEMRERGLVPTIATYNSLFRSLKECNMLAEALALIGRMKKQSLSLDYVSVEILSGWLLAVGEATKLRNFIGVIDSSH